MTSPASPLLVLDLGASGAKCLLAVPEEPKKASPNSPSGQLRVLARSFAPHPSNSFSPAGFKVYANVLASCRTALASVLTVANFPDASLVPQDVVIGASGEEILLNTAQIRYQRPRPSAPLSEQELDLLYKKLQSKAEAAYPDLSLLDARPLSLNLDGYIPLVPVGFKGEELLLSYLTSLAPAPLIKDLTRLCSDLSLYPLALAPNSLALTRACLGPDSDPDLSAVLLDVGAGTTTVSLLDAGELLASTSFSIAGTAFKSHSGASLDTAFSAWLSALTLTLEDFAGLVTELPPALILSGGASQNPALREVLDSASLASNLPFASAPVFHYLSPDDFPGFSFAEEVSPLPPDYFSALGLLRLALENSPGFNSPSV